MYGSCTNALHSDVCGLYTNCTIEACMSMIFDEPFDL